MPMAFETVTVNHVVRRREPRRRPARDRSILEGISDAAKALLDQFLALSEDDRERFLIEAAHATAPHPDVETAWVDEAVRRAKAYSRGEAEVVE